jgi:uncharacterized protein (DUF302 family)
MCTAFMIDITALNDVYQYPEKIKRIISTLHYLLMEYQFSKKVPLGFSKAIDKITEELKKQGFGIITKIDMKEILKKKINADFRKYTILGACNPRYAYEALLEEDKLGVFLPCNVIVQEHDSGEVEISIVNPEELMHNTDDLNLRTFATEIKSALLQALEHV